MVLDNFFYIYEFVLVTGIRMKPVTQTLSRCKKRDVVRASGSTV